MKLKHIILEEYEKDTFNLSMYFDEDYFNLG